MHRTLQQTQHSDKAAHVAVADRCKTLLDARNISKLPVLTYKLIMKDSNGHIDDWRLHRAIAAETDVGAVAWCASKYY